MSSAAGPPRPACLAVRGSRGLCLQKPPEYNIHEGGQDTLNVFHYTVLKIRQ
jgi:hypothetical protein